ncbi:MAG: HEAT repeat domain-containing protein [Acidobacteriia bacterium]|nr:HEAT repeat domain-containing protein [Terriglobia bacterium]
MRCKEAQGMLADLWAERLEDSQRRALNDHLVGCSACRVEQESLTALWVKLGALPEEKPDPSIQARFQGMLEGYREGLERTRNIDRAGDPSKKWFGGLLPFRLALEISAAVLVLAVGLLAGRLLGGPDQRSTELAQLREEVHDMRQMVSVSLMKQESASERLRGISWSGQVNHPDPELRQTLLNTLNFDPSVDVRLASMDAISRFADDPVLRKGLVQSLPRQSSPLVQIGIIDLLVQLQDRQSIEALRQLSNDAEANQSVRERAQWGIKKLS